MYNERKHDYLQLLNQEIYCRNKSAGTDILNRSFLYMHETTFKNCLQKKKKKICCMLRFSTAIDSRGFDYTESFWNNPILSISPHFKVLTSLDESGSD